MSITPRLLGIIPVEIVPTPYAISVNSALCDYQINAGATAANALILAADQGYCGGWGYPSLDYMVNSNNSPGPPIASQMVALSRFSKARINFNQTYAPLGLNPAPVIGGVTTAHIQCAWLRNGQYVCPPGFYKGGSFSNNQVWWYPPMPIPWGMEISTYSNPLITAEYSPNIVTSFLTPNGQICTVDNGYNATGKVAPLVLLQGGQTTRLPQQGIGIAVGQVCSAKSATASFCYYNGYLYLASESNDIFTLNEVGTLSGSPSIPTCGFPGGYVGVENVGNSNKVDMFSPDLSGYYQLSCFSNNSVIDSENTKRIYSCAIDPLGYLYVSTEANNYGISNGTQWLGVSRFPVQLPSGKFFKQLPTGNQSPTGHPRFARYRR